MKKSSNKLRIIAITIFSLGLILLATGWVMGANFMLYIDGGSIRFANEHSVSLSNNLEFSSISITSNIADIEITATAVSFSANFFTYFNNVNFNYYVEHGTLFIEISKEASFIFPIGFTAIESKLVLNIPNELALNMVTVNNFSNDTLIEGITTSYLRINSISGNANVYDVNSDLGSIHLVNGNGLFNNATFSLLEFASVDGSNTFIDSAFSEIIAGSGGEANFSFYNCAVSSFNINTRYGNIIAEDLVTNEMVVHNIFGDIILTGNFNGRSEISNNSGNTTLHIAGAETEFGYNLTTRGNVFINGNTVIGTLADRAVPNHLRVISRTGNIIIMFLEDE